MNNALQIYRSSDPTRTLTIRRRYAAEMRKRFRSLRGLIRKAIVERDVFGLANDGNGIQGNISLHQDGSGHSGSSSPPPNSAFQYPRVKRKVSAFMQWLEDQVDAGILEVSNRRQIGQSIDQTWQNVFIKDTYKRGVMRATYEMRKLQFPVDAVDARGGIQVVLSQPAHADRLGAMYTRAFNELKGISDQMGQQISRVLTQGLADGDNPRLLARKLTSVIGGRGKTPAELGLTDELGRFIRPERRAEILARTETIRAHHQGMMQTYENWGVEGVEVLAELRTAGDSRVCPDCEALEGNTYKLKDAWSLIPVHPQCRCVALPVKPENVN